MTMDDDDLEDPALGSLRAVLHGMRDEEPSDRGLASLMAAARAQAEVMKPAPSWWARLLVTLRQPPVLALASAALLVSGGLVITRHASDLDATSSAPAVTAPPPATASPAAASTLSGSAAVPGIGALDQPRDGASVPPKPTPDTAVRAVVPADPTRPAPTSGATPMMPTSPEGTARDDARPRRRGAATSARPSDLTPEPAPSSQPAEADAIEAGLAPNTKATTAASAERARPSLDSDRPATAPVVSPPVSAAQIQDWVTRCEQAASRGDCSTARSLARQVEAADSSVFRARLLGHGAVARCLAP